MTVIFATLHRVNGFARTFDMGRSMGDCFGQFLVHVVCECGAVREIEPEALARLAGPGGSNSRCNSIAIKIFQLRLEELETQQRASAASF